MGHILSDPARYTPPMLKKLQLALTTFFVMADVRSYQWVLLRNLRLHPTTERLEDAILYRHRLRQFIEEFLDSGDPHLWNLTANSLLPMLEALNQAVWEAEERLEG